MNLNHLIKKILKEETEEWVSVSPEDYIEYLEMLNGNGKLIKNVPEYRGKKIKIDGNLDLSGNKDVENIDSIDYVDGNLSISYTNISYFDENKVKGYFTNYNSKMYRIEQQKIYNERIEYQNELREEGAWEVENNDDESNETEAIYEYLVERGIPQLIGNEETDEETGEEIYNDIREDKYFLYKSDYKPYSVGSYYLWLGSSNYGATYAVYKDSKIHQAAKESLEQLVDELGMDAFRSYVWENNLDEDYARRWLYADFEEVIRDSPEDWNIKRELTDIQKKYIVAHTKTIENLNKKLENENLTDEEKSEIEDDIYDYEEIIEDINENPEGDYSEEEIDDTIGGMVDDGMRNFLQNMKDKGFDDEFLLEFIDMDGVYDDVIESDGYGQALSRFDNDSETYKINSQWFYVMRED